MAYFGDIPDHPVIRNMERTGYPDGKEPEYPHCPVCGMEEIGEVYVRDSDHGILGCDGCVTTKDAETDPSALHEPDEDLCPECGKACYSIYYDKGGTLLGCDECVSRKDAWDESACFHRRD